MKLLCRKGNPRHEHKADCTQCDPPLCLGRCGQPAADDLPVCDDCWQFVPNGLKESWHHAQAMMGEAREHLAWTGNSIAGFFEGRGYDG